MVKVHQKYSDKFLFCQPRFQFRFEKLFEIIGSKRPVIIGIRIQLVPGILPDKLPLVVLCTTLGSTLSVKRQTEHSLLAVHLIMCSFSYNLSFTKRQVEKN